MGQTEISQSLNWPLFGFMLAGYVQDKTERDGEGSDRPGEGDKATMMNHCFFKIKFAVGYIYRSAALAEAL